MTINWAALADLVRAVNARTGVSRAMDEGSRRIVSNERIDFIKAYERETTYRGRAVAANNLWLSLSPHSRTMIAIERGHHGGVWLQEQLGPSDAKLGYPPLTSNARHYLRVLLLQETGTKGRPGRDVSRVWKWLDAGDIQPGQLKLLLSRANDLMQAPGATWEACLERAKELAVAGRGATKLMRQQASSWPQPIPSEPPPLTEPPPVAPAPSEPPPPRRPRAPKGARGMAPEKTPVDKTLQYQAFRKVLDEAPEPRSLPIPAGVDASTYRSAYTEMLENVRVVLEMAGRDFGKAKRQYRSTEISLKAGALAKACRTLRVAVPPPGQPVDEFASRRKWLEIVKAYHPDKNAGDASKVQIFDAANKAFETIKDYNRKLADQKSEETRTHVDDEQQGAAKP